MKKIILPLQFNYVPSFIPKYIFTEEDEISKNVRKNYDYASLVIYCKVQGITYIPFKESEFYKFFKNHENTSICRPRLKDFYNFLNASQNHINFHLIKGVKHFVIKNWKFVLNDLGMWFSNNMLRFKKLIENYQGNKGLDFLSFRKRFMHSLILNFLTSEQKRVNKDINKLENISKVLKKDSKGKYYLPNHSKRNTYKLMLRFIKLARKNKTSVLEYLITEAGKLRDKIQISGTYLGNKFNLTSKVINDSLAEMEKNNLLKRTKVLKRIFQAEDGINRKYSLQVHDFYTRKIGNSYFKTLHTEIILNEKYQPGNRLNKGETTLKARREITEIKLLKKYKIIK